MRPHNQKLREQASGEFAEASKLASANGMSLRPLAYADNPGDVTQYRIEGPGGRWFKDLYPGAQRIYCPNRAKQGPYVSIPQGARWTLLDIVKLCVRAQHKFEEDKSEPRYRQLFSGDSDDTKVAIAKLVDAVELAEGTDKHGAFRDILTDARHVAKKLGLDFSELVIGSYDVWVEESDEEDAEANPEAAATLQQEEQDDDVRVAPSEGNVGPPEGVGPDGG